MNWLYYLLEANLYLAIFYGFYRLLLHRETFYSLNRYYLTGAALLAFVLPLLQIGYIGNLLNEGREQALVYTPRELRSIAGLKDDRFYLSWISPVYFSAVLFMFLRLGDSLIKVLRLAWNAPKEKRGRIIYVKLCPGTTAFSFFNLLFLNPDAQEKNTIIQHEMVHIRQKHSLDVLFFELIGIFSWFNPLVWLMKKDLQLLHEYIADENSTNTGLQKHEYAMFLIHNSFGTVPSRVTSQIFNQSILKMRINMLNKKRSAGPARLRLLFVLPLVGGMLCASTMAFTKDYATVDLYPKPYSSAKAADQDTLKKSRATSKKSVPARLAPPPPPAPPRKSTAQRKGMATKLPPPIVVRDKKARPAAPPAGKVKFPPPILKDKKNEIPPPPPPVAPGKDEPLDGIVSELKKDGILKNGMYSLDFSLKNGMVSINGEKQSETISKKYTYLLNLKEGEGFGLDIASQ